MREHSYRTSRLLKLCNRIKKKNRRCTWLCSCKVYTNTHHFSGYWSSWRCAIFKNVAKKYPTLLVVGLYGVTYYEWIGYLFLTIYLKISSIYFFKAEFSNRLYSSRTSWLHQWSWIFFDCFVSGTSFYLRSLHVHFHPNLLVQLLQSTVL